MRVEGARALGDRAAMRAMDALDRFTAPARVRNGASIFMFGSSPPCDRVLSTAYFAIAARRWGRFATDPHHHAAFAVGMGACTAPTAVLDIGTGAGASAGLLADRWPDATVVAIDTSPAMLKLARERHRQPNLTFRRASVLRLPFPDASFDLLTALNAIPELGELRRVSRPGAEVLMASTTLGVRPDATPWVARWREAGFDRVAAADVDGGSWELYRLA